MPNQVPGEQYDRSTFGDMLGDPETLLKLASILVPNFRVNNAQFKPREALRAIGDMYGQTADRQALQGELGKVAGRSKFSPPAVRQDEVDIPGGGMQAQVIPGNIEERVDYVSKFKPQTMGEIIKGLSPRAFKAATRSQTAMGDFGSLVKSMREDELGVAGQERSLLQRQLWSKLSADPFNPKLHQAIVALSDKPGEESERFGGWRAMSDYLAKYTPTERHGEIPFLARFAQGKGLEMATNANKAKQQAAQGKALQVPKHVQDLLESGAKFAQPLDDTHFEKIVSQRAFQARLDDAKNKFPELRHFDNSQYGLPVQPGEEGDFSFKGLAAKMQEAGYGDVAELYADKQRKGLEEEAKLKMFNEKMETDKAQHAATLEEHKAARASAEADRAETRRMNEYLKRQDVIRRMETTIHSYNAQITRVNEQKAEIVRGFPPKKEKGDFNPDGSVNVEKYETRLRNENPVFTMHENREKEIKSAQGSVEVDKELFVDPSGNTIRYNDQALWGKVVHDIATVIPKAGQTTSGKASAMKLIEEKLKDLEYTKSVYKSKTFTNKMFMPMWEQDVYTPTKQKLMRLRFTLGAAQPSDVTPPSVVEGITEDVIKGTEKPITDIGKFQQFPIPFEMKPPQAPVR